MAATGYPWYWRFRTVVPGGLRRGARRGLDAGTAFAVGSVNRVGDTSQVCLTLDDGPDPVVTPAMLSVLDDADVRCTFFLLADRAKEYPALAREIVAAGHEVALHGRDHRPVTGMGTRQVREYLGAGRQDLEDVVGIPVRYFRPPYGAQSLSSYRGARRAGLEVVVWSADAQDWVDRPGPQVVRDALAAVNPGGILLFHERLEPHPVRGAPTTGFDRPATVTAILEGLQQQGLRPVTVGAAGGRHRTSWFRP